MITAEPQVSVLIPAHNEADYIGSCLDALCASDPLPEGIGMEILVLANGCHDATVEIARSHPVPSGWDLWVLDLPQGGKLAALNAGDATAKGSIRIYLDADVLVEPPLLAQLVSELSHPTPRYASGTPMITPALSRITRAYGRFWSGLPFVQHGVPGFGLFAMNLSGRKRWRNWPDIIADDLFARLSFAPDERIKVSGRYSWPMVEGFRNLVRVRRRQNAGVTELAEKFPQLMQNEDKQKLPLQQLLGMLLRDPLGFLTYAIISLTVKSPLFRSGQRWTRGR